MNARERDAESPDRRRWLVRALAAMPAMLLLSPFPRAVRAQSDQEKGQYVLSSEGRARQIRQLVSSDLADKLRSLADGGLGRELHPRAVVHTQGLLPHEQDRDASLLSPEDWRQTLVQGLAWCVSGDAAYAAKAVSYIQAWVSFYSPSFDPIDEADLIDLLLGFRLRARTALGLECRGDEATWPTIGDRLSGHEARRRPEHRTQQLAEPPHQTGAAHGENWYGMPSLQGRLAAALHWLEPYAAGDKQHEEFVHSTVRFDARRAAAHVKGYAGLWQRKEASNLYWIASRLDPEFTRMAHALDADPVIRALFA
jgi:hypothetical protein